MSFRIKTTNPAAIAADTRKINQANANTRPTGFSVISSVKSSKKLLITLFKFDYVKQKHTHMSK